MPARRSVDLAGIAEGDSALALEPVERRFVGLVIAVMMGDREDDLLAGIVARGEGRLAVLDFQPRRRGRRSGCRLLRISAPGSSRASVSTWKPLQMPSTSTPRAAASLTARITGDCAAIAPERR